MDLCGFISIILILFEDLSNVSANDWQYLKEYYPAIFSNHSSAGMTKQEFLAYLDMKEYNPFFADSVTYASEVEQNQENIEKKRNPKPLFNKTNLENKQNDTKNVEKKHIVVHSKKSIKRATSQENFNKSYNDRSNLTILNDILKKRREQARHDIFIAPNQKEKSHHRFNLYRNESPHDPLSRDIDEMTHRYDDVTMADAIAKIVRVLCWITTHPDNHKKARHIKETWGQRCTSLLFMSTGEDPLLPTVKLPVPEGRDYLWGKTKEAFRYIYQYHLDDAEWFLKADDDTYIVMENLRYMLLGHNPNEATYYGCRFRYGTLKQGYMSGGAGYVLSREGVIRLVTKGLNPNILRNEPDNFAEDLYLGRSLEHAGVKAMDTRDPYKRGRFFPMVPLFHMFPGDVEKSWYWKFIYYPVKTGRECCSEYAISFHYISPSSMYALEYFLYHLRPFGISYTNQYVT